MPAGHFDSSQSQVAWQYMQEDVLIPCQQATCAHIMGSQSDSGANACAGEEVPGDQIMSVLPGILCSPSSRMRGRLQVWPCSSRLTARSRSSTAASTIAPSIITCCMSRKKCALCQWDSGGGSTTGTQPAHELLPEASGACKEGLQQRGDIHTAQRT